jgi:serine/threonine protein kinase, bacterial
MDAELLAGIGGYPVERKLGAGGMGLVYLCRDESLQRAVAIKVLRPELLEHADMQQRFLREARALARVSSPYVVNVYSVGEDAVVGPFVVMELLEGEDLLARLKRTTRVGWRDACVLARDACAGLIAAHDAGLVHRDVKPANLFVVAGRAKLTDFGLAREVQGSASVTHAGLVVGTPAYLAPELVKGGAASAASDLYSLGATLFHALVGQPPFPGDAPLEVLTDAISKPAPRVEAAVPEVPQALADLIDEMLRKDPAQRPAGFAAVDARIKAIVEGTAVPVAPSGPATAAGTQLFAAPAPPSPAPSTAPGTTSSIASSEAPGAADSVGAASAGTMPTLAAAVVGSPGAVQVSGGPSGSFPVGEMSGSTPRVKSASLTVMMTDIAGYTERTGRQSRDESARWLALHDQLLQPVFKAFGGKVIKTLGDAFLVTFSSPTDAVLCGCAVQDRLFLHNQGARTEDHITVRVALSAGEVRMHKGDVFGEPVNLAARIESVAKAGEVMLSDAVFSTMNAAEVKLEKRGEESFKGIARAVTLYAAVPDGLEGQPPFGGRALGRVKESSVGALFAQAPVALERTRAAFQPALASARRLPPRKLAIAAALLVVVVVVVPLLMRDSRRERIKAGEAKAVLIEIESIPADARSADDLADLGFALLAVGSRDRAFTTFRAAVKKGADDGAILDAALAALSDRDDDGAKELLAQWPNDDAKDALEKMLNADDYTPRHHALDVLDKRKVLTDAQRVKVGMRDIDADDCGQRRAGLLLLKKSAKGPDALDAVKKLGNDMPRNLCMAFDVGSAESAIRKRTEED